jgi:hypothetical protein
MRRPTHLAAAVTATVLLLAGCADEDPAVEIESQTTEEEPDDEVEEEAEPGEDEGEDADGPAEDDAGDTEEPAEEPADDPADGPVEDPAEDDAGDTDAGSSPTPDPDLLADPCGPHEGREGEAFIEVVSPVDGQDVGAGDEVQLTGCSNVFEANVVWELVTGDGTVVDDGFTTATCGSGCVGAFDEVLDLSAGAGEGDVELHVSSPDVSDGEGDGDDLRQVVTLTYG